MRKIIPEQFICSCDMCDAPLNVKTNWSAEAILNMKRHAVDWQGSPCANASYTMDLCNTCEYKVTKAIDDLIEETKEDGKNKAA